MFEQFLTLPYLPFAISFVVMVGIGLIEAAGLGLGQLDLDSDIGADGGSTMLDWLGLGDDIPILIWLTALLACFTLCGIAVQQIAAAFIGAPLHWLLASAAALVISLPLNTFVANGLMRILPGFETTVVHSDDLVRLRGVVMEGTARRGAPARLKVVDQHGQAHVIMVEPHNDADVITAGDTALIIRHEDRLFFVLPDESVLLRTI
jgi:hypothetical protein